MKGAASLLAAAPLIASAAAGSMPAGLQQFYDSVKPGKCTDALASGFHNSDGSDSGEWSYCQQGVAGKAIFLKGNGKFANMDIDCDGNQKGGGAGSRCGASQDTQSETSFKDTVSSYGIPDLNANVHPYVVFGNEGSYSPTFSPQKHGIKPLSVMAVVCDNKVVYGVWGDTNGDDGPPVVGEASISLATACFGNGMNGNSGHGPSDVLYIAFPGDEAVPGKNGAKWNAGSYEEFEASIQGLGDKLIAGLTGDTAGATTGNSTTTPSSSSSSSASSSSAAPATTLATSTRSSSPSSATGSSSSGKGSGDASCEWSGHCAGAKCSSDDDCSGEMTCSSGKCGSS